jgi:hypothetical protein
VILDEAQNVVYTPDLVGIIDATGTVDGMAPIASLITQKIEATAVPTVTLGLRVDSMAFTDKLNQYNRFFLSEVEPTSNSLNAILTSGSFILRSTIMWRW